MKQLIFIFCLLLPLFSIGQKTEMYDVSCVCEIRQIIEKGQPICYEFFNGLIFEGKRTYELEVPYDFKVTGRSIQFENCKDDRFTLGYSQLEICNDEPNNMLHLLNYFKLCATGGVDAVEDYCGEQPPDLCDGVECTEPCTACNPETGECESICDNGEICNEDGICVTDDPCPDCPSLTLGIDYFYQDGVISIPGGTGTVSNDGGNQIELVDGKANIKDQNGKIDWRPEGDCGVCCLDVSDECIEGITIELSECSNGEQNQVITTTELEGGQCVTSEVTNILPCEPEPCDSTCLDVFYVDNQAMGAAENPYKILNEIPGDFIQPSIKVMNPTVIWKIEGTSICGDNCGVIGTTTVHPAGGAGLTPQGEEIMSFIDGEFGTNSFGLFDNFARAHFAYSQCDVCDELKLTATSENGSVVEMAFLKKSINVCNSDVDIPELTKFDFCQVDEKCTEPCPENPININANLDAKGFNYHYAFNLDEVINCISNDFSQYQAGCCFTYEYTTSQGDRFVDLTNASSPFCLEEIRVSGRTYTFTPPLCGDNIDLSQLVNEVISANLPPGNTILFNEVMFDAASGQLYLDICNATSNPNISIYYQSDNGTQEVGAQTSMDYNVTKSNTFCHDENCGILLQSPQK